ncbi:uncharacterized protein LOC132195856 [Neocloeon triangulifer]|uniref:uncharacterized protein LOC132195856 n=1 Tax=Neocloeon triangulifer TaxID=2078957 RepID=UPI00286EF02D|nr:uncharacterized protein LOC132195856 [Neocloeon triangulifer]
MLSRIVRPAARNVLARQYHSPSNQKLPTMNDLPVPQGSWQQHHASLQRRYNTHLAVGVTFCLFSFFVAKQSGLFFFNWGPELKNK